MDGIMHESIIPPRSEWSRLMAGDPINLLSPYVLPCM